MSQRRSILEEMHVSFYHAVALALLCFTDGQTSLERAFLCQVVCSFVSMSAFVVHCDHCLIRFLFSDQ